MKAACSVLSSVGNTKAANCVVKGIYLQEIKAAWKAGSPKCQQLLTSHHSWLLDLSLS